MKLFLISISLFICFTQMFHCQENDGVVSLALPVRNSMTFNRYVINPTFSFVREQTKYINITNKKEWIEFENSPESYLASFAGRFGENIGAGIGLFQQNYGVLTTFGGILNFAYNAQLSRTNNLTFGLNLGAYSSGINTSKVITNSEEPSFQNVPKNFLVTVNPGVNYGTDFLDFGVSINNLVTYDIESSSVIEDNPEQGIQGHLMYTGYIDSRGFFDESKFSGLLRSEFKKNETVISAIAMVTVPKGIWAQLGYNTVFGVSGGLGLNITKSIAIEYNYETAFGDLSVFGASHDISLAYRFNKNRRFRNSNDDDVAGIFSGTTKRRRSRTSRPTRTKNTTVASNRKDEAEISAEKQAREDAEALLKLQRENELKAKIEAEEQARIIAEQKAKEQEKLEAEEKAKLEAEAKAEAERLEKSKAKAQSKIAAERAKSRKEAEAKAKLLAEQKSKEEARLREQAEAKLNLERQKEAQAKLIAEQKAKEEAEKAAIEQAANEAELELQKQEKEKADAEAKLLAEQKAKQEAQNRLRLEEERKLKAQAEAEAKLEAEAKAEEELISNPKDKIGKDMYELEQKTKDSKSEQVELFKKLNEAVAAKDQTLKDLKEENDLSEKGITVAPKPFKSITAENNALLAIKSDLDNIIKTRTDEIEKLKALYEEKFNADTITNDTVMLYYKNAIKRLTAEQATALETRTRLDAQLETIRIATEFERRRRIKRADFDNEEKKYSQDRAVLKSLKENTALATTPYEASDFDFGEEQGDNIKILKNVNNVDEGYFLVIAVHNDKAKRDEFLKKVIASGRRNVDFFYDVNTSKYYIYYDKFDNISAATQGLKAKGDRPYNGKMSLIKIEK